MVAHRDGGVSPCISPHLGSVAQVEQGMLGPSTSLRRLVPQRTEVHPSWRGNVMNSMVLTSGEVTGLSQDRVSKQDTVAGKHK